MESVYPLTFDGGLKFSVLFAVMVTKNSKWRNFWGDRYQKCVGLLTESFVLPLSTDMPNFVTIGRRLGT